MVSALFFLILVALLDFLVHQSLSTSSFPTFNRAELKLQEDLPRQINFYSEHGAAAVVSLQYSEPNRTSSKHFDNGYGRQLEGSARMTLHDDLLTKGYFTSRVWIGTPAREFALIVDTGSTVTYVPCSSCTHCGRHQDPRFAPELSSTYQPLKCGVDCDKNYCQRQKQCKYERQYAEMSTSSGLLGKDLISFGNKSMMAMEHLVFGCETVETGDLFYQTADGIMGLGRGPRSIVDQLVQLGAMSNSFSLCYGGMDEGGGAMILGTIPSPSDMVFTTSDPNRSPYYNVKLEGVRIAGNLLPLDPSIFDGRFGTILDSGTTYAYFPEQAFNAFHDAIKQQLGKLQDIAGPDAQFPDVCFAGAGNDPLDLPKHFPSVDFVFGGGEVVSLAPENYLFRHTKVPGAYCLGIFKNGKDPTTLLGGIVVRNMLVTYDRANDKIGFWKTKCKDLLLNLPAAVSPSAAPLTAPFNGTSPISEPSVPIFGPAEPPETPQFNYAPVPAPELQTSRYIGGIEIDMIISTNYSTFRTSISEFINEMAHELDVDHSQVSIVKYTDHGNNVSVLWLLSPEAQENKLLESTAQSIISRLQRHEIHLGGHFGVYEVTSWKLVPISSRSRLSHGRMFAMVAAVAAAAIFVVVFGVFVYRRFWRYRGQGLKYITLQSLGDEESLEQL